MKFFIWIRYGKGAILICYWYLVNQIQIHMSIFEGACKFQEILKIKKGHCIEMRSRKSGENLEGVDSFGTSCQNRRIVPLFHFFGFTQILTDKIYNILKTKS